jgi:hypothetical protein
VVFIAIVIVAHLVYLIPLLLQIPYAKYNLKIELLVSLRYHYALFLFDLFYYKHTNKKVVLSGRKIKSILN